MSVKKSNLVLDETDVIKEVSNPMPVPAKKCDAAQVVKDMQKMSNSTATRSIAKSNKSQERKDKFINRVKSIVDNFSSVKLDEEDERVQTLFLFVMQMATDFLPEDEQKDVCLSVLKPVVNGDEELCRNIMSCVKKSVKPLTTYRLYHNRVLRLLRFFFGSLLKTN